jgi:hypothetical protein
VAPGSLTPADGESDDPQDEQHNGGNPQEMNGESGPEDDQDEQQRENEQHEEDSFAADLAGTLGVPREEEQPEGRTPGQ